MDLYLVNRVYCYYELTSHLWTLLFRFKIVQVYCNSHLLKLYFASGLPGSNTIPLTASIVLSRASCAARGRQNREDSLKNRSNTNKYIPSNSPVLNTKVILFEYQLLFVIMSRAAYATFTLTCIAGIGIVAGVHKMQKDQREVSSGLCS
jgi:hypothetical protein